MARLKLIDYLNDPTLLEGISEVEMIAWAAEVPYSGLVQRLLAQKLAIRASKDNLADEATTMAILSNANPDQVISSIEDFKSMILAKEALQDTHTIEGVLSMPVDTSIKVETAQTDSLEDIHDKSVSENINIMGQSTEGQVDGRQEEVPRGEVEGHGVRDDDKALEDNTVIFDDEIYNAEKSDDTVAKDEQKSEIENLSEFSKWLNSLKSLDIAEHESSTIVLEDKALASDTLVRLLVSQGHNKRAIAMYKILMLKNPQKSSFFAAQIQKLKAL